DPRRRGRARRRLQTRVRRAGADRQCRAGLARVTALAEAHSERSKGIVLVVTAAIAWSTAPFFTRLLHFDSWTILFWRGLFGAIAIVGLMTLIQGRDGLRDLAAMGPSGWLVASLSTLGMVCFIPALQLTSVANVAIIIATGPFFTAAL